MGALQRLGYLRLKNGDTVCSVAFSRDSRTLATSGSRYGLMLWSVKDAHPVANLIPNKVEIKTRMERVITLLGGGERPPSIDGLDFSPVGRRVAFSSGDRLYIHDLKAGREVARLKVGAKGACASLSFGPRGKTIGFASHTPVAILWRAAKGGRTIKLVHESNVHSIALSPARGLVDTATEEGRAFLWKRSSGRRLRRIKVAHEQIYGLDFSPDSRFLVTGGVLNGAIIWRVSDWRKLHTLRGHERKLMDGAFTRDGKFVMTASIDRTVRIWRADTGRQVEVLGGHKGGVFSLALTGERLISASYDTTALVWNLK